MRIKKPSDNTLIGMALVPVMAGLFSFLNWLSTGQPPFGISLPGIAFNIPYMDAIDQLPSRVNMAASMSSMHGALLPAALTVGSVLAGMWLVMTMSDAVGGLGEKRFHVSPRPAHSDGVTQSSSE